MGKEWLPQGVDAGSWRSAGRGQQLIDEGDRIFAGRQISITGDADDFEAASDIETERINADHPGLFDLDLLVPESECAEIGGSVLVHEAADRCFVFGERVRNHHRLAIDRELTELAEVDRHQRPADIRRVAVIDPPSVGEMAMFSIFLESLEGDHELKNILFLVLGLLGEVQGAVRLI